MKTPRVVEKSADATSPSPVHWVPTLNALSVASAAWGLTLAVAMSSTPLRHWTRAGDAAQWVPAGRTGAP